jgi:glucose-6-phosphate 1-dehydrogenase
VPVTRLIAAHAAPASLDTLRVVIEKPVGHDLASAEELVDSLQAALPSECVLFVDHYLGKDGIAQWMRFLHVARGVLPGVCRSGARRVSDRGVTSCQ